MKVFTKIVILTTFSTFAFSDITMCFKKNHEDISTIENVKLNGGLCEGVKSQKDMLKDGWKIQNVKIKKDDYLYVFEKQNTVLKQNTKESLKSEILTEIEDKKQKEIELNKKEIKLQEYAKGEKIYKNKCSSCHGIKAEKELYNLKPLNSISLEDFQDAIKGYKIGSYNLGNAQEMRPYAIGNTAKDIDNIYKYILKINK
ncbi:MAG: cytochrome c [Poseidonibacter sp.]|uniref:c-type cytochrome n=1 Tax=Poseidonibacter sp. TaxID=2321188 RepID=UPI00359E3120